MMSKEIETFNAINDFTSKAIEEIEKQFGIETLKKEEPTVIQQFNNGQAIILRVIENEDGERETKVDVTNAVIVLPKIDSSLDIFNDDEVEDDE